MSSTFISGSTIATIGLTKIRKGDWKPSFGEVEERAANAPISLENPGEVFYVEEGAVDVFSVPPASDGRPAGARRYLWTAGRGETLFGFDPPVGGRGHTLVAVCNPGTRIRRMATSAVEEEASRNHGLFVQIVESFVARLAGAMVLRPELDAVIQRMHPLTLKEGQTTGTLGEMLWVQHMEGRPVFGGLPEIVLGPDDPTAYEVDASLGGGTSATCSTMARRRPACATASTGCRWSSSPTCRAPSTPGRRPPGGRTRRGRPYQPRARAIAHP